MRAPGPALRSIYQPTSTVPILPRRAWDTFLDKKLDEPGSPVWETVVAGRMLFLGPAIGRRNSMTKLARIAVAAAVLLGGTSLATAKTRGVPTPHGKPFHPGFNETTSGHTAANPYYRLSDQYYDYSDPYRGLYNFFAVPPYVPGYTYGHVKMPLR